MGFIVGDALGVPVEFIPRKILSTHPVIDMLEYGTHNQPIGTWSDDSSMMLATLDSISQNQEINFEDIMNKFEMWLYNSNYTATDHVFDVGGTTIKAIQNYKSNDAINCGLKSEYDNGNGSLMRILPISLYCICNNFLEQQEVEIINNASSLTHGHEISKLACKIYTDYLREIIKSGDKIKAYNNLKNNHYIKYYDVNTIEKFDRILTGELINCNGDEIKSTGYVLDSLEASIWCILNSSNYKESVITAVNLGDDTDTIGAITGSIAGILYGKEQIPNKWLNNIKKKDMIEELVSNFEKNIIVSCESKIK